jgi:hypothetical protein
MDPSKCLAGIGAPVPQETILKVLRPERLLQERVIAEIDHPAAEVIAGPPVGVHFVKFVR